MADGLGSALCCTSSPAPAATLRWLRGVMVADSVTPLGLHYPGMQKRESACLASENEHASGERYEPGVELGLHTSGLLAAQKAPFFHCEENFNIKKKKSCMHMLREMESQS